MPPSPSSPARNRRAGPRNLAGGQGPRRHREAGTAVQKLDDFMKSQGLDCTPSAVPISRATTPAPPSSSTSRKSSASRPSSTNTPTSPTSNKAAIEQVLPEDDLRGFRGPVSGNRPAAQRAAAGERPADPAPRRRGPARLRVRPLRLRRHRLRLHHGPHRQVLGPRTRASEDEPRAAHRPHQRRRQVHGRARRHRRIHRHAQGRRRALSETAIRDGYTRFKAEKNAKELAAIAAKHGLATAALQTFVDGILDRMIFDGEQLSDLLAPLDLGWKARTQAELALMADLHVRPPVHPHTENVQTHDGLVMVVTVPNGLAKPYLDHQGPHLGQTRC
jgi:type I restriction enzyme, R subunit